MNNLLDFYSELDFLFDSSKFFFLIEKIENSSLAFSYECDNKTNFYDFLRKQYIYLKVPFITNKNVIAYLQYLGDKKHSNFLIFRVLLKQIILIFINLL